MVIVFWALAAFLILALVGRIVNDYVTNSLIKFIQLTFEFQISYTDKYWDNDSLSLEELEEAKKSLSAAISQFFNAVVTVQKMKIDLDPKITNVMLTQNKNYSKLLDNTNHLISAKRETISSENIENAE